LKFATFVPKAAKRIINFDKMCRSCSDLNYGVTFLEHSLVQNTERQQKTDRQTCSDKFSYNWQNKKLNIYNKN